jgi:hypothetical protein
MSPLTSNAKLEGCQRLMPHLIAIVIAFTCVGCGKDSDNEPMSSKELSELMEERYARPQLPSKKRAVSEAKADVTGQASSGKDETKGLSFAERASETAKREWAKKMRMADELGLSEDERLERFGHAPSGRKFEVDSVTKARRTMQLEEDKAMRAANGKRAAEEAKKRRQELMAEQEKLRKRNAELAEANKRARAPYQEAIDKAEDYKVNEKTLDEMLEQFGKPNYYQVNPKRKNYRLAVWKRSDGGAIGYMYLKYLDGSGKILRVTADVYSDIGRMTRAFESLGK